MTGPEIMVRETITVPRWDGRTFQYQYADHAHRG